MGFCSCYYRPWDNGKGDHNHRSVKIQVECYSGYRGEETPRRLTFGVLEIEVAEVLDQWFAPDHRYFKVRGDDGATYILRHDMTSLDWELVLFEEKKP